jgi:hypothetical protein
MPGPVEPAEGYVALGSANRRSAGTSPAEADPQKGLRYLAVQSAPRWGKPGGGKAFPGNAAQRNDESAVEPFLDS